MLVSSVPLSETHTRGPAALGDERIEFAGDPHARTATYRPPGTGIRG